MAGRADFLVDLEAALGGGAVVGAERALEVPVLVRRMRRLISAAMATAPAAEGGERDRARDEDLAHGLYTAFFLSTASAMLGGNGSGRSILPRTGSRTRKWKK